MYKIILLGNPFSTNSLYRHARGISYMTRKGRLLKESYTAQAREQWKRKPTSNTIEIHIKLFFGDKRVRDWDNFHKISMDALTGIIWEDDVQIQKATVEKSYSKENPRVEIEINVHKKQK